MKKIIVVASILCLSFMLLLTSTASAQEISSGCNLVGNVVEVANPTLTLPANEFFVGDRIRATAALPGTEFTLSVDGSTVAGPEPIGNTLSYTIQSTGSHVIAVTVTGSTPNTLVSFDCSPSDEVTDPNGPVTICHYPPGNPDAAHTLTVGAPAKAAHLAHGDTEGACSEDVESRFDTNTGELTAFILDETGEIQLWGNCVGQECQLLISIDIYEFDFSEQTAISVPQVAGSPYYVVFYYLHQDPSDERISVYQINIYRGESLISDDILLFVDENGDIYYWATQSYWADQIDDEEGDE